MDFKTTFLIIIHATAWLSVEGSPKVFLTISSLLFDLGNETIERQIELNWYDVPQQILEDDSTYIGLYNKNPTIAGISNPLVKIQPSAHQNMTFRTDVIYPRPEFEPSNLNNECLGFWIALVQKDEILAWNCKRARPRWMWEMKDIIGDRTLTEIFIPGTHDAGTYEEYRPHIMEIYNQTVCQDEDIWNQLVYGIRYLDIRAMYSKTEEEPFWIEHGKKMNMTIRTVLEQVRKFVEVSEDIVILDFHKAEFPGQNGAQLHDQLQQLVEDEIGKFIIPRKYGYELTLNELWKSGKQVLVGYPEIWANETELFYDRVCHLWGDKRDVSKLEAFFEEMMCNKEAQDIYFDHVKEKCHSPLRSAMAQLTSNFITFLIANLREWAQRVNLAATAWFRDRWWDCPNIVAMDFFHGSDIVEVAIEVNKRRFL